MRNKIASLLLALIIIFTIQNTCEAANQDQDSRELQLQDMLMLFLGKPIEKAVNENYSKLLTENPMVYPYQIKIVKMERLGEFRSFHFLITLEMTPVVGPHIEVGEDRLTFEISPIIPDEVKLVKYEHLHTYDLPTNWKHIQRKR
ncbi:DUF3888 domain-containing protein [Bacillus sp. CGMCC 1.16607]|uniref:DUF3888 domain-containing protein n=1 Tax=Bacillus sp. CGMCC 1.16607 TaxID=3351842 RepID=UPI00362AA549